MVTFPYYSYRLIEKEGELPYFKYAFHKTLAEAQVAQGIISESVKKLHSKHLSADNDTFYMPRKTWEHIRGKICNILPVKDQQPNRHERRKAKAMK